MGNENTVVIVNASFYIIGGAVKEDTATGFNEMTHPEIISTGKGGKMIYLIYVLMAAGVVWFSSKAAVYVDMLEARTRLSGAFLGGVMLSAVTSLPELFTSLSTTILLNKPGMCLGNILGSADQIGRASCRERV